MFRLNILPIKKLLKLSCTAFDKINGVEFKATQTIVLSFILFAFGQTTCSAFELPHLLDWTKSNPQWRETKPGLAHFSSYCSTLYDVVGDFYAKHPIPQQRRNANIFLSHSHIYSRIGFFLTVKGGTSTVQTIDRHWALKSYLNDIVQSNFNEQKSITEKSLTDDLELCQNNLMDFKEMAKDLEVTFESHSNLPIDSEPASLGPLDMKSLNKIWSWIKVQTAAPENAEMPLLVIQSDLPPAARLMFEFPTENEPDNPMQISVSPRTLYTWSRPMMNWAIGHEFLHYAMLMRENHWKRQAVYKNEIKHHCNPEFMALTAGIADLISDTQPQAHERLSMYAEIFRSCTRFPDQ